MNDLEREHYLGWGYITAVVLLLAAIFTWLQLVARPSVDDSTLCEEGCLPPAATALLVDKTDPLTASQVDRLDSLIKRVKNSLVKQERFSIFVLQDEDVFFSKPVFSLCNPGTRNDANQVIENPTRIQQRFEKKFGEPLSKILVDLQKGSVAQFSPVMEMIRHVATSPEFQASSENRRLIVFSDLLQNVPRYSHYSELLLDGTEAFGRLRATRYFDSVSTDLSGLIVDLVYLQRDNGRRIQGEEHLAFWRAYLSAQGAQVYSVPLPY